MTEPQPHDLDGQLSFLGPEEIDASKIPDSLVAPPPHSDERPPSISRVWFADFKSYKDFTAQLGRFNVLVGANNAGKSTLLQGVDLLYTLIRLLATGDTLWSASGRLVPASVLPVATLPDLFFQGVTRKGNTNVEAKIGAEFSDGSMVEFGMRRTFGNCNARVLRQSGIEFDRLRALLARGTVWVPSAAGIVRDEEFRTGARRTGLISAGRHNEVLRNLLVALSAEQPDRFSLLQDILSERFQARLVNVEFDGETDQFVSSDYRDDYGSRHDLYSAGAGFVQIVQLLAFLLTREASVVLLDEPDAHLHSSLQPGCTGEVGVLSGS